MCVVVVGAVEVVVVVIVGGMVVVVVVVAVVGLFVVVVVPEVLNFCQEESATDLFIPGSCILS